MRVAMLSVHTSPLAVLGGKDTGGMNVYVRELSRELGRRGVTVDVFTRSQDPSAARLLQPWPQVRVIHVPAGPEAPHDRRQLYQFLPEFVEGVRAFATSEGASYDLIHSHYWLSGWVALQLREGWRAPVVQMFHTLGRLKDVAASDEQPREARERTDVEAEIMRRANRVVAATPADRGQMIELCGADPARITVIPPGVDLELFRPIPRHEARAYVGLAACRDRMLLFVGRLDPVKGLNVLFEALCLLLRELLPGGEGGVCLAVIGGDSESAEALRDEAVCLDEVRERYGLSEMVAFLGSRSQDTLPYYYCAADVCVMPSLYESFGLVALEAMACGTPVVASRVGGLPHLVGDGETGLLVPENDPAALAEALKLLLSQPGLRERLGARALEVAREYSWERVASECLLLYQEVLAGGRKH
ncbi:MAG: glycosyltransferase [Anaerolineae bacterium]|nr:glycosyltransferase [Anaerolineae bacterium]